MTMDKVISILSLFIYAGCGQDTIIIAKGEDDCQSSVWYLDSDQDGFGSTDAVASCDPVEGYVQSGGDCDDTDPTIAPNSIEVCNEIDDDCDNIVDNDLSDAQEWYLDADGDGFGDENDSVYDCAPISGYISQAGDCDDSNSNINPDVTEVCDELDNNCDDIIDNELGNTYYIDSDGDGYGDINEYVTACSEPIGYVDNNGDCDDNNENFTISCDPISVTEQVCQGTPYFVAGPSTTIPELHILSAYEPTSTNEILVHVDRTTQMTLVLSSYEPVNWIVTTAANTQIDQILLNGYHTQSITIDDSSIPIETRSYDQTTTNFGSVCGYSYPYNGGGCDTDLLLQGLTNYTGLDWTSFSGCYTAEQFLLE